MNNIYDEFYNRIPDTLLADIGSACVLGDKAYSIITKSEPRFFRSEYSYGLCSRVHDKVLQFYLENRFENDSTIKVYPKRTGYGNSVVNITGTDFGIMACRIRKRETLPGPAKYKSKACEFNPGKDFDQVNLFAPPIADEYKNIEFFITLFFDGMNTVPNLILADNSFSVILDSRPIISVIAAEAESTHIERIVPQIIAEMEKEYGKA